MKTFRKIFIGALALLFGSWVNMQAQDVPAGEGSTVARVVKHKSPKTVKQQRAEAFIAQNQESVELGIGVKLSYVLSADCSKKGFSVKASNVFVNVPDAPPIPLWKVKDYTAEKTAAINGLEQQFADLKSPRPGESSDSYEMRLEELKELRFKIKFLSELRNDAMKAEPEMMDIIDRFVRYIISGGQ